MTDIISIIGNARIEKVEKRSGEITAWNRRIGFVGFEGYLVIKVTPDGKTYACIDDNRRCITTSCGTLDLSAETAVFTTQNSIYTFTLCRQAQAC